MNYILAQTRYDSICYNHCGHSGLKLPAISLGLWHNFKAWTCSEIAGRYYDELLT